MLRASEFVFIQAQATIFTPGLNLQTNRALAQLLTKFAHDFDGEPISIPLPEGFPHMAETLRFLLQSKNGGLRLQAASSRLDIFQMGEHANASRQLPAFLDWCLEVFDKYLEATQGQVGRLATVALRRASVQEPAKAIASHFCKEKLLQGPLNRPSDFELHAAKQFTFYEGMRINSWFRCKTAIITAAPKQSIVLVEQDFNTLEEEAESRQFSPEERRDFFSRVPDGFLKVLNQYFEEGK